MTLRALDTLLSWQTVSTPKRPPFDTQHIAIMTNMEHAPKTFQVHAHKPSIESLLGIKYIFLEDSFMITNISDESIFKGDHAELRVGHEVVEVNGTPIKGQTKEGVRTLLGSLGEAVVFVVKSSWVAKMELE